MKVLLDVLGAPPSSGGMHRYAIELVRAWTDEYPDDEVVVLGGGWITQEFAGRPNVTCTVWTSDRVVGRAVGQHLVAALVARRHLSQAVVSVSPIVTPLVRRRSRACIVHDWRHVRRSAEFSRAQRAYRSLWRVSVASAGTVIAISEKTAQDTRMLLPRTRPVVVSNGRDHAARWPTDSSPPPQAAGAVVTFGHHTNKRPDLVLDAYAREIAHRTDPPMLTILGARGRLAEDLRRRARSYGIESHVDLPGFVGDDEYQARVRAAGLIVLASTDEGFGLPVAEADWFGIPCVVTDDSGLAEIHPQLKFVCRPTAEELAACMATALDSPRGRADDTVWRWRDAAVNIRSTIIAAPIRSPTTGESMLTTLVALLPAGRMKNHALRRLGHAVDLTARIAPVLLLGGTRIEVGQGCRIGPLNAFRNLTALRVGDHSEIGQLNWVSAAPFLVEASGDPGAGVFAVGEHGSVTNRHYIDASGGVGVGRFAILAGVRSTLMTHGIDVRTNELQTAPVTIGEYAMVGSNTSVVPGAAIPARCVVAMGSVVPRGLQEEDTLYAGVPARAKRRIDVSEFASRVSGKVLPQGSRRAGDTHDHAASSGDVPSP